MAIQAWHIMKEKISVAPETSVKEIVLKMVSSGLAAIPVVSEKFEVRGLATEHAVLGAIQQGMDLERLTAAAVMVKPPLTAEVTVSQQELVQMMMQNSCCSVVTLVSNGKYAGVVSRHMLMDIYTSPHFDRFAQRDRKAPFLCL